MSVSSIFSTGSSPDSLAQLYAPASTTDTSSLFALTGLSPATSPSSTAASGTASSTSVSSQGQLLSQLQAIQTNNPAEFQKVTADISKQLQAAASQAGGSQGQALSSLAAKFQQASQTGSLTPLQSGTAVHGHRHGGGHHHGGGAPAASANPPADASNTASDSVFNAASLTSVAPTVSSALSSASSLAASAYQQFSGQGIGSVANSIIGSVLNTGLGTSGSVSLSA